MPLLLTLILLILLPKEVQEPKPLLLLNGTVHLGDGTTISNAALAIAGDSISLLGDARVLRMDMTHFEVVGVFGNHIYPAQVFQLSDSIAHEVSHSLAVPLNRHQVLAPRQRTKKTFRLQEGMPATLLVTDTLMAEDTRPQVLRAFVTGQAVALPDSSAHNPCH